MNKSVLKIICMSTGFWVHIASMEIEKKVNPLEPSNFTRLGVLLEKRVKKELQTILDQAKGEKEDILVHRKKGSIVASQHRMVETLKIYLESLRKNIATNEINDRLNVHYSADNDKELWDSLIHIIPGAKVDEDFKIKRDLVKKIELQKAIPLYMNLTDMRNEFYGERIGDKERNSNQTASKNNKSKEAPNKKNNQQCIGS